MAKKRKPTRTESYLDIADDFQQHKYHPGYFTGGRIDPVIRIAQRRGSAAAARLGCVWVATGGTLTTFGLTGLRNLSILSILQTLLGAAILVGGIRMIRGRDDRR